MAEHDSTLHYSLRWNDNVYILRKRNTDNWCWVCLNNSRGFGASLTDYNGTIEKCIERAAEVRMAFGNVSDVMISKTFIDMFTYWADRKEIRWDL